MATQSAPESTENNRKAQAAIGIALATALAKAWPIIDVTRLKMTIPLFTKAATAIVQQHASAARGLSVAHYADMRHHAGVTGTYRPPLVDLPSADQVQASVKWGTQDLWTPTGGSLPNSTVIEQAQANVSAALEKAVDDVDRNQIIAATESDRQARVWAREAQPGACWFCSMMATRGAIYTSAEAAGKADPDDGQMPTGLDKQGKEFVNRYHDHCKCRVVPVFGQYEPSAHTREWQALWDKTMNPPGGKPITGMDAMQTAWRKAFAEWQQSHN